MMSNNTYAKYYHKIAATVAAILSLLMNFYQMFYVLGGDRIGQRPGGGPPVRDFMVKPELDLFCHIFFTFLIAYLLFALNYKLSSAKVKGFLFLRSVVTTVGTLLLTFVFIKIHALIIGLEGFQTWGMSSAYMGRSFLSIIVVIFVSQILMLTNQRQENAIEIQRLSSENIRSRYNVLKMQLNPHFLFNSLNTLNSLIHTDPEKSQEYVQQLSLVLRHSLQDNELTTLREDVRFAESFCYLMKIRYGDNLVFNFSIDPKYNEASVLPLSLQILLENAIKHNVITNKLPLVINVHTFSEGYITVSNHIQLKREREDGEGIGLANLMERCRLVMHKEVEITDTEDTFTVKVPLLLN